MKRKQIFSRKWQLVFSLMAAITASLACGSDYWSDILYSGSSAFAPEPVVADKGYSPLFYTSMQFFYGVGHDENHTTRFNEEVTDDWHQFLKGKISKENIATLLLSYDDSDEQQENFIRTAKKDPDIEEFIEFCRVANYVDILAAPAKTGWDYYNDNEEKEEIDQKRFADITLFLREKYEKSNDPFLKNRYWFQYLKALFYNDEEADFEAFFNDTGDKAPKNTLYYRVLGYLAAIKCVNGDYMKANLLYAQIFNHLPAMRQVATSSFYLKDESVWEENINMATTNDEKAGLWTLLAYKEGDEERAIREIIQLDPENPHLDLLLTRLINKTEETGKLFSDHADISSQKEKGEKVSFFKRIANWFGNIFRKLFGKNEGEQKSVTDNEEHNQNSSDSAYNEVDGADDLEQERTKEQEEKENRLYCLVTEIAQKNRTANPFLWNLAAGYASTRTHRYSEAEKYYRKAEQKMPSNNREAEDQLQLLRFVNSVNSVRSTKSRDMKVLAEQLVWLDELQKRDPQHIRYHSVISECKEYLSNLFLTENKPLYAEMLEHDNDFFNNSEHIDEVMMFFQKKNPEPIEEALQRFYIYTLEDLYHYKAVEALFSNNLEKAIEYIQQSGRYKDVIMKANPFNGFIQDCNDCQHTLKQSVKYSSLSLLQKMQEIKNILQQGNDVYNNAILLGNAFYNLTYYGSVRHFWDAKLICDGTPYKPYLVSQFAREMLLDCSLAERYYKQALNAAENDEQRAKATFMLAKCERNAYYNQLYLANSEDPTEYWDHIEISYTSSWENFRSLKEQYEHTTYYQEVIEECGDFKSYLFYNY